MNISVTKEFNRSVLKVILSIMLFFILYLLLLVISLALLVICAYLGVEIIAFGVNFFTIVAGAGIFVFGLMFFIFVIKFVFANYKNVNPYRIQITENDQPRLFRVIKEVSKEVGTDFPKKVYLTYDINAGVFYNSSFWSLFFPVKKNLEIGLGLINSVSLPEFKAILAHEFGHFSQKSMRLGSYVYTVNHVIFKLVHEYDGWDRAIEQLVNVGRIFGWFVILSAQLANVVRLILRKAYNLINIQYYALSRQMEFHADAIAGLTIGKEHMISALRRVEFCDIAFQTALNLLGEQTKSTKFTMNIYDVHSYEIVRLGNFFKLKFDNNLPIITKKDLEVNKVIPRVNFKNLWASHPSIEEREEHIMQGNILLITSNGERCWSIIDEPNKWQELVTSNLYQVNIGVLDNYTELSLEEYKKIREEERLKYIMHEFYNGFYDDRLIYKTDINALLKDEKNLVADRPNEWYSKEIKLEFNKLENLNSDLTTLNQIKNKEIDTKYFEFDNKKYHSREVKNVIKTLENEIKDLSDKLKSIDTTAIKLNIQIAADRSNEAKNLLLDQYHQLNHSLDNLDKHSSFANRMGKYQFTLYSKTQWTQEAMDRFNRELCYFDQEYKTFISPLAFLNKKATTDKQKEVIKSYMEGGTSFIGLPSLDVESFNNFVTFIFENHQILIAEYYQILKQITDLQIENYQKQNLL